MRPIRLLILLLAVAIALALALVRPLQGRALRVTKRHGAHPVKFVPRPEPRRHLMWHPHRAAAPFGNPDYVDVAPHP